MRKPTHMLGNYLLRFFFRLAVMAAVLIVYLTNRKTLDFTANRGLRLPLVVLWVILLASFSLQLSPKSPISRGCLKQFPQHFCKTEIAADPSMLRAKTREMNRGAMRVAIVWAIGNLVFAWLYYRGIFGVPEMLLISVFYYLCDVICIVFYCPFQKLLMKNKCCATCRIFAWGTIMIATPLLFIPAFYSWSIAALAIVCTARWEITYRRHPERFCEETNAYLRCACCTDRLCTIKHALEKSIRPQKQAHLKKQ